MVDGDHFQDAKPRLVAEFRVSDLDFPLMETLESFQDIRVRSQFQPGTSTAAPEKFFVIENDDFEALEAGIQADPSVQEMNLVTEMGEHRTYRIRFTEGTTLLSPYLIDRGIEIDTIDKAGTKWEFRVVANDRSKLFDALTVAQERCDSFSLERLSPGIPGFVTETAELTPAQRETLTLAHRKGYFEVPRETTLAVLGEELGVSDSAVSERIRNAVRTVVEQVISPDETTSE